MHWRFREGVDRKRYWFREHLRRASMFTKTMRLLGATALVGAAVTAISPSAKAADYNLGGWDVQVDNTVSFGASWLMKERENQYIPLSNGGPADNSVYVGAPVAGGARLRYRLWCVLSGIGAQARPNFDGSINADDGRLNFDQGDLFSSLSV